MPRVKTEIKISGWDNLVSIDKFLPILGTFADIFEVSLTACVHQEREKARDSKDNTLFIHFFYRTTTGESGANESGISEVLNYSSLRPLRYWKSYPYQSQPYALRDFKGITIAHRDQKSIFIDFDFLQNSWNGHEDVLFLILWYLIPAHYAPSSEKFLRGGERLAEYLRNRFTKTRKKEEDAFSEFLLVTLKDALATCESQTIQITEKIITAEEVYMRIQREVKELEEYLQWLPAKLPDDETLGKEFDALGKLPDIVKVKVHHTDEGTHIRLSTRRLIQMIPPPPQKGKRYEIGSFVIHIYPSAEINPSSNIPGAIFIKQNQDEQGPYQKQHIDKQSCLGNKVDRGLNYAAARLWAEASMGPLVQLILTFLKFDVHPPMENSGYKPGTKKPEPDVINKVSQETHALERERYIDLMKKVRKDRLMNHTAKNLAELLNKADTELGDLIRSRIRLEELKTLLRFLREKLGQAKEEGPRMFKELALNPAVVGIELRNGLRVWLYDGKNITFPRILWITSSGLIRLLAVHDFNGKALEHAITFGSTPEEETARNLLAEGNYPQLLAKIVDLTTKPFSRDYGGG